MPWPKKTFPHTTAQYDGACPNCGGDIYEGDEIYLIDSYWVCESCKEDNE